MTEQTEKRALAFIRTIGNRCTGCMRRSEDNCSRCISRWANEILAEHERETAAANTASRPDYSLAARMIRITDCLVKAKRPLLATEIDTQNLCSKQLKSWTLRLMVSQGRIAREKERPNFGRPGASPRYRYYLPNNKTHQEKK